jgi:hypothetical protein
MKYSKHFEHKGITVIFDKLETNKEYPTDYIALRSGNDKPTVFIPKKKFEVIRTLETESIKIFTFGYCE